MRKARKHYTAEEKVAILRRHLLDKEPVSTLCDELALQPTVFYRWQKEFFENGAATFQTNNRSRRQPEQERIARLEKKIQTKDEVLAELMAEHNRVKKKPWGTLTKTWTPPDVRDQIVDFVRRWSDKTEIHAGRFIQWLGIAPSKFYSWRRRYGSLNEHNGWVPRDFWLEEWEKQAILDFYRQHPLEGYRRLTFMMLDADIVAVSPSSVWAGVEPGGAAAQVERQNVAERDGLPTAARAASTLAYRRFLHQHLGYVLLPVQRAGWLQPFDCALGLARGDEGGRHRDHSPSREGEIPGCQTAPHLRQRAAVPRQGLQGIHPYLGDDARENVALLSTVERQVGALAQIVEERMYSAGRAAGRRRMRVGLIQRYVEHYNTVRLHSAIGFVTPEDLLAGRRDEIHAARDRKLEQARQQRQLRRRQAA